MSIDLLPVVRPARGSWHKDRIVAQKRPLLPQHVWSIRVRLEMTGNARDLALFNMAIDSKLRGSDLVAMRVRDVFAAGHVKERASMTQSKTGKPVRFKISDATRSPWTAGSGTPIWPGTNSCGQAGCTAAHTCPHGSMPG